MDLHDALQDLHREWRGAVADRAAGPVVAAARRRRAVRRTGYGAVGAGAAAALVVGGLSLPAWRPTPPPAQTSTQEPPAPSPTPTPTRTAAAGTATSSWTPTPDAPYEPDLAACGTTVGDLEDSGDVYSSDGWTADAGAPLALTWRVESDGKEGERVTVAVAGSYLTQGGPDAGGEQDLTTVIGVPTVPPPGPATRVLDGGVDGDTRGGFDLPLTLPFVMCPGVEGAGGPPPNGDYLVWSLVDVARAGTTTSTWASSYGRIGAWVTDPRFYLPAGTTRYDTRAVDFGTCDTLTPARLGLSPEAWVATDGPLTAQASGRLENGDVVVSLRLTNDAKARPYLEVRYPSVYVVANEPFSGTYNPTFAAGTLMDTGNIGRRPGGTMDAFQGGAPRWAQGTSLGASASLTLETELRPTTCASLYADPWPAIIYTVYAFTEVALPDGTVTRVQAAPATFSVP